MPLVLGDRFATGTRSRAEIQFDGGNFARLSADTEVRIGELGNKRFEIEVLSGLVSFSQFDGFEADVDVETSLATVRPIKPAVFVVEHHGAGQTDVTVRAGAVEVFTDDEIEKVKGGLLSVRGAPAALRTAKAEPKSGFDDWAKRRDKLLEREGRDAWQRWVPNYLGFGLGYGGWGSPWGWGYGGYGFGPLYRTTIFYRGAPRVGRRGGGSRRGRR
jgi:ferric-dicitrate binding protein FerR (iron transport regulator)